MLVADDVEADAKMDWRSVVKYAYGHVAQFCDEWQQSER